VVVQSIGDPSSSLSGGPSFFENMTLIVDGQGKQNFLKRYCQYVYSLSVSTVKDEFKIYSWDLNRGYWAKQATKRTRPEDTIILPENIKSPLLKDLTNFVSNNTAQWYQKHYLPYKRSYLFYGTPGSGKSSFIQVMAGILKRNVYYLQPSNPKFSDDTLKSAILSADSKSIIILEDIDALFDENRNNKSEKSPLTFSGLLNALDGITNVDGHIFVLTTNFIDRLDPALIRDGRVDYKVEFPSATREQLVKMFLRFYENENGCAEEFANNVEGAMKGIPISMAKLQNHFIKHQTSSAKDATLFTA